MEFLNCDERVGQTVDRMVTQRSVEVLKNSSSCQTFQIRSVLNCINIEMPCVYENRSPGDYRLDLQSKVSRFHQTPVASMCPTFMSTCHMSFKQPVLNSIIEAHLQLPEITNG